MNVSGNIGAVANTGGPGRGWRAWIVAGLILALVVVNGMIWRNEGVLRAGEVVLLPLAPVDPRSLMQGDYMDLSLEIESEIARVLHRGGGGELSRSHPFPEYAIVAVGPDRTATFQRLQSGVTPLLDGEVALRYQWRQGSVEVVPRAFFFEEGRAEHFAAARYGELRVAPDGRALLTGLRDGQLDPL